MSVIKVNNLSKRYRLGLKEKQTDTLVGQISQVIRSPWNNLKRLRELNRFGKDDESVFWALKDVSFEVKEGEVLGIIGKNGAGKSTLLKILSQITEPTSGKIEIHGRVASLLEVGTGFHPELSGRENIYMNGTILGMTRREINSKLDEIIDFSGVEKFIDTPVKFYSSGMKVRLGFSVAAHLNPEVLIIDEVLAVGDYEFQKKCLGKMEDVSKNQGRTVLFVSHNMPSVRTLCSKTLVLERGNIKFLGSSKKAIENYTTIEKLPIRKNGWDLRFHPDKKQTDKGLKTIRLLKNDKISNKFFTRDKFIVELDFEDPSGLNDVIFGLIIKDSNDNNLIGINNRDLGQRLNWEPIYKGVLRFELDSLPIYGNGFFHIDLFFGDGGDNYDTLFKAISFEVLPNDLFNNAKVLNPKFNMVDPGKVNITLTDA